jgi:sugar phosphate isomerase/epimerase
MNRRELLGGIAASGALAMTGQATAAADRRAGTFFARSRLPIGLQLYTLGDEAGRDLDATFAQVAAIGYRDIELPGLYGKQPAAIREAAAKAGLSISSLHVPAQGMGGLSLGSPPQQLADILGALGVRRAVAPIALFPADFRPSGGDMAAAIGKAFAAAGAEPWKRTAALLNTAAAGLKPLGISVGYHNHNMEFAPIGDTNGWQILLRETDPRLVNFEVDVGWVAAAGLDPAAFLKQHHGRVAQLHVKDVAKGNAKNYAIQMKPAEVGSGTLDWKRILPAALQANVRNFYVEQEPPFTIPRIEAARKSYQYLAALRA